MKKFICGVVVGALLFSGVSVAADSVSLIGKKVSGTYTVMKDGKKIADAAIINGSAYAPVRAISQATGTSIAVEGKTIIVSGGETVAVSSTVDQKTLPELLTKREKLVAEIKTRTDNIADLEGDQIPTFEAQAKELQDNGTLGQQAQETVDRLKGIVERQRAEITEIQKELDLTNAQIAELQK